MMLSRVSFRMAAATKTAPAFRAAGALASNARPAAKQLRFVSSSQQQQVAHGSKGRKMPAQRSRATAPVAGLDATFTIRVSHVIPCGLCLASTLRPAMLMLLFCGLGWPRVPRYRIRRQLQHLW